MEHVSKICSDEIISRCAGWEKVPHATSVDRIIKSVRERNITELEALVPRLRDKVWKRMVRNGHTLACAMTDDLYKTPIFENFCYVTTEKKSPMETHRHYGKRATSETWIEECKSQMGAGQIRTSKFLANSALFQCGILAYNILKWMGLLTGTTVQRWEVKTIRLWLIRLAGKLVSSGRQLWLSRCPANLCTESSGMLGNI